MTLVLIEKGLVLRGLASKIEVIWVPGIYIYTYICMIYLCIFTVYTNTMYLYLLMIICIYIYTWDETFPGLSSFLYLVKKTHIPPTAAFAKEHDFPKVFPACQGRIEGMDMDILVLSSWLWQWSFLKVFLLPQNIELRRATTIG